MKQLLLVAAIAGGLLSSCSTTREIERRKHLLAAEQALAELEADAKKTPEQKLEELYKYNPALRQKPAAVVREVDTVRTAAVSAAVTVAPVNSPQLDRALGDSLVAVLVKLAVVDSTISGLQKETAASVLSDALRRRPKYSADTARAEVEGLLVSAWFTRDGRLHVAARKKATATAVEKVIEHYEPIREPTAWEKFLAGWKVAAAVLAVLGLLTLFFILFKRRSHDSR